MIKRGWIALCLLMVAGVIIANVITSQRVSRTDLSLFHHLYLWNRAWNDSITNAIKECSTKVNRLVVLAGQVDNKEGQPVVTKIPLDYAVLRNCGTQMGLAIRVSTFPNSITRSQTFGSTVGSVAKDLLQDASKENLTVSEIQLDFDCPESRLSDYRGWITALKPVVAPASLTITALPTWLKQSEFEDLAKATDGFVLQVHSFRTPKSIEDDITLCDPKQISRWVNQASQIGVPFRVALPTYGYVVAFDPNGKFAGLWAEGPQPNWPPDYQVREVHTDPKQIAKIVRDLQSDPPPNLTGILWFRMPTSENRLNWRWPTLSAVMEGRTTEPKLEAIPRQETPGLVDLDLVNTGEADMNSVVAVSVHLEDNRLIAADANDYGLYDIHGNALEWCRDHWLDIYKGAPTDGRPWLEEKGNDLPRVMRGGYFYDEPAYFRSAMRGGNDPDNYASGIGFRVVRSP